MPKLSIMTLCKRRLNRSLKKFEAEIETRFEDLITSAKVLAQIREI
jgi:hypothetical protein